MDGYHENRIYFAGDRERSRLTGLGPAAPAALRLGKLIHGVGVGGDGAAANSDDGRRLQFAATAAGQTQGRREIAKAAKWKSAK